MRLEAIATSNKKLHLPTLASHFSFTAVLEALQT